MHKIDFISNSRLSQVGLPNTKGGQESDSLDIDGR